ncbi:MAG: reprolysin-like metallopeptidase [Thiolinea sp.]
MKTGLLPAALCISLTLLLSTGNSLAEQPSASLWQDISAKDTTKNNAETSRRIVQLDENQLRHLIANTSHQTTYQRNTENPDNLLNLEIPLPNGSNASITLQPVALLSAELQQRYPLIKTWKVSSDHPDIISGRAELTARGFYVMLRSRDGDQWLIEPDNNPAQTTTQHYQSFSKRQSGKQQPQTFSCGVTNTGSGGWSWSNKNTLNLTNPPNQNLRNYAQRPGENLLSYDLAVSATGEYTQKFGGSQASAYSAIITTVNRINEIYEQELGITLKLVSGTETVFTDPANDPFDNTSSLLSAYQNQQVLDTLVGSNRYDIGHVLGSAFGGDGIALVSSVCGNGQKAQGFTASNILVGDSFIVDYVAHELGHQLGATHTFNGTRSSCGGGGRIAETAFEPGSGGTIMSYAGLCGADNFQQNVDPQFHIGSIEQIHQLTHNGSAAACATNISLNNKLPVVNAGSDHTIPARTPFILNGSASDSDGDTLLYGWDQVDLGAASALGTDTANNALIKSNRLSNSGLRHVPDIAGLLNTSQAFSSGESLPRSNRELNFRLIVRDGKGASSNDTVKLNVHDTGQRFSVLHPASSLSPGSHEIRWQVAGTDQAPINCAEVDIAYTNNQGTTFIDVLRNTPNDGAETVQLNNRVQNIRVKCSSNVFFALSGTTPHVASYKNDTDQSTDDNTDTNTDGNDNTNPVGGGGSIPLPLLLISGAIVIFIRLRHTMSRHANRQRTATS